MSATDFFWVLLSCVGFMAIVAYISHQKSRDATRSSEEYFLAGRSLGASFIAGSLLLTNLSAEQLIGLNGSAYGHNLSSMAWEVTAAFATVLMAFIFLPRYLAGAFTTLPEFLRHRYDESVRRMTVALFMLGYGLVTIPSVLYAGSIAVLQLFDLPKILGFDYGLSLVITIFIIGVTGALYAILGGLKAVAVSDTLNGIGLLVIGLTVPVLGIIVLGDGSFGSGLETLVKTDTQKLNAIGNSSDPTPFSTLFTGMLFANLFYWCTNQYVIQRTLAAKSLAEGQRGVILSGFLKVFVPFLMMIPGVIAYHLYGPGMSSIDLAYPRLVRDVLPVFAMGFFLAVLLGAVFSSFNSLVNSAATLFCIDIYKPLAGHTVSDDQLVITAKRASLVITLVSILAAPFLQFASEGLWQIIRIFTGFYNIPIVVVVGVGLFTRQVPALAAKFVILFHLVTYGFFQFVLKDYFHVHFLHLYAILFFVEVAIMLFFGAWKPRRAIDTQIRSARVDLNSWVYLVPSSISLVSCVLALYLLFSPVGLVGGISIHFTPLMAILILCNGMVWLRWYKLVMAEDTAAS